MKFAKAIYLSGMDAWYIRYGSQHGIDHMQKAWSEGHAKGAAKIVNASLKRELLKHATSVGGQQTKKLVGRRVVSGVAPAGKTRTLSDLTDKQLNLVFDQLMQEVHRRELRRIFAGPKKFPKRMGATKRAVIGKTFKQKPYDPEELVDYGQH